MKRIKNYQDYLFLLNESKLYMSDEFISILKEIEKYSKNVSVSQIAHKLIELIDQDTPANFSYIDKSIDGRISFLPDAKSNISDNEKYHLFRQETKVGRFAQLILGNEFNSAAYEIFTNVYRALINKDSANFQIVKGEDIRYWYNVNRYADGSGQLNKSCMRDSSCQTYFDIYVENPKVCSMLILLNDSDELLGRALIWKLNNGEIYMDRIYTITDSDMELFEMWKIDNKYTKIVTDVVKVNPIKYTEYPYMDTFIYYSYNLGILSHNEIRTDKKLIELNSTSGSYNPVYEVYDGYNNEYIDIDDSVWCESEDEHCNAADAIYLSDVDRYVFPNNNNYVYSKHRDKYYLSLHCTYSSTLGDYIYDDNAIYVYMDKDDRIEDVFDINQENEKWIDMGDKNYYIDLCEKDENGMWKLK